MPGGGVTQSGFNFQDEAERFDRYNLKVIVAQVFNVSRKHPLKFYL